MTSKSPTSRWLGTVEGMPPLDGPAGTAERILLLLHYGIDWSSGWVGRYRATYWSNLLPDRVIVATYRAGTLARWWSEVASELEAEPRSPEERRELEQLLRADALPVLEHLRHDTQALLLRTRITAEAVRSTKDSP